MADIGKVRQSKGVSNWQAGRYKYDRQKKSHTKLVSRKVQIWQAEAKSDKARGQ